MQVVRLRSRRVLAAAAAVLLTSCLLTLVHADETPPSDLGERVPWTTSRIQGSPEPPPRYVTERAFPALQFRECVDLVSAPGSDRLFVVEQRGKIFSFPNRPDVAAADLLADLSRDIPGVEQTYALAFHPDFQRNRFCYICYIKASDLPDGTHVARFRVTDTEPPQLDLSSETTIITWLSGGHNGCCLKFGPDGCLYISTGDGVGPNPPDTLRTGQDLSDLLSSILRIDVDRAEQGRNYRIPPDNPFVNLPGARGEIWAYGLRNPWRMSFDRQTGDLWVGDVGWELWELLYRVERGGNYGWAVMEGRQPTNPEWPRGPTPILPPTIDHSHTESSSITDGLTYYGQRLPELHGMHIYSDYDTGKFWGFRFQDGQVVDHQELADTTHRVVGFGEDQDGEFYILDHTAGTIHRLIPNPQPDTSGEFPRKLSDTGLFASVASHYPAPGVLPYAINAEPWADYATAQRLVALPQRTAIRVEGNAWHFPENAVLAKTLWLEFERGNPASRRQVETQLLHFDGREWQTYTYEWNADQTDADLVGAAGAERVFHVADPAAPGGQRQQVWRFASRAECQRCHNRWSGPVLGFNPMQLDRERASGDFQIATLKTFQGIGLVEGLKENRRLAPLVDPHDASIDLEQRARAYLHVNCAHCHRKHAGGAVLSQMQFDLPLEEALLVGVRPTLGTFGILGAQVIAPGDPSRSILLYRMAKLGGGRMPHLGSTEVDQAGVQLIRDWIQQMSHGAATAAASDAAVAQRAQELADIGRLRTATGASEEALVVADRLLSSASGALLLSFAIDQQRLSSPIARAVIERGGQHADPAIRDLFERYLPAESRTRRLGSAVRPEEILSISGDAERGRRLFFEASSISCRNCHRIGNEGKEVGPELTTIGRRLSRGELLESMLEPSKRIEPKYVTHVVETRSGKVLTGLLLSKDESEVIVKDAQGESLHIPANDIEQLVPQQQSLMPELLLRDMTADQVADLLEFLSSLR